MSNHAVDAGDTIANDIDQLNISDASTLLRDVDCGNLDVVDSESDLSSDDGAVATSNHSI